MPSKDIVAQARDAAAGSKREDWLMPVERYFVLLTALADEVERLGTFVFESQEGATFDLLGGLGLKGETLLKRVEDYGRRTLELRVRVRDLETLADEHDAAMDRKSDRIIELQAEVERLRGDFLDAADVPADEFAKVRGKYGRDHAKACCPLGGARAELARLRKQASVTWRPIYTTRPHQGDCLYCNFSRDWHDPAPSEPDGPLYCRETFPEINQRLRDEHADTMDELAKERQESETWRKASDDCATICRKRDEELHQSELQRKANLRWLDGIRHKQRALKKQNVEHRATIAQLRRELEEARAGGIALAPPRESEPFDLSDMDLTDADLDLLR